MASTENKTQPTEQSVESFLDSVEDERKRVDSYTLLELIGEITGDKPVMWGSSIVGFGTYHYKYASGREGEFMVTGFSPRKRNLTIYIMPGFDQYAANALAFRQVQNWQKLFVCEQTCRHRS